ncbi:MAG TPA: PIG-L family deacetylase [Dongiaceae bacterium]|nr:PIG-L family deacetylase [Dongiaceae bacterium]
MRKLASFSLLGSNSRTLPIAFHLRLFGFNLVCLLVLYALCAPAEAPAAKSSSEPSTAPDKTSPVSIAERFAQPPGLLYQGVPAEIPQDQGVAGLRWEILRLGTTARLMQVVAHPDDEDGGLLTLQARGHGVSTLLMTLNRGEGGQNKIGSNLSDVLGVLRTEELLASDQHYGVQDRFSRVADFGFSKNPEETFEKWGGHDVALADMVRVIRTFRPDVLVARFSGTSRDGHGNHQASALLTKEAFHAAADPKRFPEQIAQGLEPWQPKKLYIGNVCPWGSMTCPDADWTVKFNTGQKNTDLGMSYVQFAMEGLRHQQSQGAANWTVDDGDRFTFYRRIDSVLPPSDLKPGHEEDFFDGIDTSWQALASRFDDAGKKLPALNKILAEIAGLEAQASTAAKGHDPSFSSSPLMQIVARLNQVSAEIASSSLSRAAKLDLLTRIADKQQQAETALNLALGVTLTANVSSNEGLTAGTPKEADALTTVSPGQEFMVGVTLHNGSKLPVTIDRIKLEVPAGWNTINGRTRPETVAPGKDLHADFRLKVPDNTPYTRPYWHRDDPNSESVNHIDIEKYATLPFPPPALQARVEYAVPSGTDHRRNGITVPVVTPFLDSDGKQRARTLAIVPSFSVALEPGTQVISTHNGNTTNVTVGVASDLTRAVRGDLRLELPQGWRSEPAQSAVNFSHRGEKQEIQFKVFPAQLRPGRDTIRAVFQSDGQKYSEGYTLVTREDLGSFYYYQPARQRVSIVDVQAPHDLKIGYIMGAGDDIPPVLQQIGMNITMIPADHLATEDLSKFGTIVLGIRAYDTQKGVVENNKKLLDFVQAGGTLVVQYDTGVQEFNGGHFTPYPADLSRARVSVEEAPVEILAPQDPIFNYPNKITEDDFKGWVQERGLYFMSKWDDRYIPLLSCHDPGEDPQKGGLLRAQYGKGTYIYTGYAFFRQLPAGVPGAVRLFVNILSAGHEKH